MKKLKILHTVEYYSPSVGGAQEVVRQLSEHLVKLGHDVTVATTKISSRKSKVINGVKIMEFDIQGNNVRGYLGHDVKKYQHFLIHGKYDVIMNYAAQQWASDLAFTLLDQINARKIFVPCGYSGLYDSAYSEYFQNLPSILKKYDKVVYLSNHYRDIDFGKHHGLNNGIVIQNGADEREFNLVKPIERETLWQQYGIPKFNRILLCVSNHTGQKGHSEAIKIFNKANLPYTSLVFVGDVNRYSGCYRQCLRSSHYRKIINLLNGSSRTIHILNLSRSDTIKLFFASDLFIFLSNIECSPLVLFESAAAGIPFFASDCGNSQEIASWTKSGMIAASYQNKQGFTKTDIKVATQQLESLMSNSSRLKQMGDRGRKNWRDSFTWDKISHLYEQIYLEKI